MLTNDNVKDFMQAVSNTHWNLDFNQFKERLKVVGDGRLSTQPWAEPLWVAFQKLHAALCGFNADSLAAVLVEPAPIVHVHLEEQGGMRHGRPACGADAGVMNPSPGQVTCPTCKALLPEHGENGGGG